MDQSTHEVRLASWEAVVRRCQERPKGTTTKQWLADNDIPDKQYYYWLRKIRKRALADSAENLPAVSELRQLPTVSFAEIPAESITDPIDKDETDAAVVIKTAKATIRLSSAVSESTLLKLVKAVAHAL